MLYTPNPLFIVEQPDTGYNELFLNQLGLSNVINPNDPADYYAARDASLGGFYQGPNGRDLPPTIIIPMGTPRVRVPRGQNPPPSVMDSVPIPASDAEDDSILSPYKDAYQTWKEWLGFGKTPEEKARDKAVKMAADKSLVYILAGVIILVLILLLGRK